MITLAPFGRSSEATAFHTGTRVRDLVFDPRTQYLVSLGEGQYTVWDLKRRESESAGTLTDVGPVGYSPDGRLLVIAGISAATIFTADGSRIIRAIPRPNNMPIATIGFTPDSRALFIASGPAIFVFDAASGALRRSYDWRIGPIHSLAVAPDGLTAAAGASGRVVVWDLDD